MAVGCLAIIEAEGKERRQVGDCTANGSNNLAALPEIQELPTIDDVSAALAAHYVHPEAEPLCAVVIDVKAAHK